MAILQLDYCPELGKHVLHPIALAVSLTWDDQASWSVDDLIHPSDIVDVLAEHMGAQLTLTLDGGPTVRLTVPASRFATESPAATL